MCVVHNPQWIFAELVLPDQIIWCSFVHWSLPLDAYEPEPRAKVYTHTQTHTHTAIVAQSIIELLNQSFFFHHSFGRRRRRRRLIPTQPERTHWHTRTWNDFAFLLSGSRFSILGATKTTGEEWRGNCVPNAADYLIYFIIRLLFPCSIGFRMWQMAAKYI